MIGSKLRRVAHFMPPGFAVLLGLCIGAPAVAQDQQAASQNRSASTDQTTITGSVVSSSRNTLLVRDGSGRYWLFVYDRNTRNRSNVSVGSNVRVRSSPTEDAGVRLAQQITPIQGGGQGGANEASATTQDNSDVIPPEVRNLESQIEREARRFQVGVRTGVGLDPELIMIGVQSQLGPFFSPNVYLRPNVDFGFGEVTSMFGLNLEAVYRLPLSSRQSRWSAYFGAGPGFNFVHQNFEKGSERNRIDFGDFHSDTGLNVLGGVRFRSGTFMEVKTSLYTQTTPTLRLILGYNF